MCRILEVSEYSTFSVSFFSLLQKCLVKDNRKNQKSYLVIKVTKLAFLLGEVACNIYSCVLNYIPLKNMFKAYPLVPLCKCDRFWKQGLYKCNQVDNRSHTKLGRALIPYDWCPPKKRRRPTDTERRQLCEDGDKEWSYADTNQGMPGATRSQMKRGRILFQRLWREHGPLDLGLLISRTMREHILVVLSHPSLWHVVTAISENIQFWLWISPCIF